MDDSRKISLSAAVLMSINIMIGAGIFFGPQLMATPAGTFSFLGWPLVALLLSPIIINVAAASRMFPGEGGFFNYCRTSLGEVGAFMATWSFFMGYLGAAGVQITVVREAFINNFGWSWAACCPLAFNVIAIIMLSLLNLLSVAIISKVQSSMTLVKLMPLFFVIGLLLMYYNPSMEFLSSDLLGLGLTVPVGIFAYNGWESCCNIGHLIRGGSEKVPVVIFTAFGIVVTLYTIFHLSILHIMGVDNLIKYGAASFPLFLGASQATVNVLKIAIAYAFLISYVNALYGVCMANVTTLHGLVRKSLLPGSGMLSVLNKNERPALLVWVYGLFFLLLITVVQSKTILVAFTGLGAVTTFMITLTSLFIAHVKNGNYNKLFIVVLGFLSSFVLFYFSFMSMGAGMSERLMNVIPILIGYTLGYCMLRFQQACKA